MNKTIFPMLAVCSLLLVTACTEKNNTIAPVKASDTTYMASAEAPTERNVLVEECTGVRCNACPAASSLLKSADEANNDRLVIVALHSGFLTTPIEHYSKYDFRTQQSADLTSFLGEVGSKPMATIDRVQQAGEYFTNAGFWLTQISNRVTQPSKQNITISSDYNAATRQAVIRVRVMYTATETKKQKFMVVLTESNIIDAQSFTDTTWSDYNHDHVLRDLLTPYAGAPMIDTIATKAPGRVYERTFIYTVNAAWNADNCHVVAYVFNNEGEDKEVGQVAERKLVD